MAFIAVTEASAFFIRGGGAFLAPDAGGAFFVGGGADIVVLRAVRLRALDSAVPAHRGRPGKDQGKTAA